MKKLSTCLAVIMAFSLLFSTGVFAKSDAKDKEAILKQDAVYKSTLPTEIEIPPQDNLGSGEVGIDSVTDPESVYNSYTGGKDDEMYASIYALETGLKDGVHMYYEGEGHARWWGSDPYNAQTITCTVSLSCFGIMPSVSISGVSASGTTSATAAVDDVRNNDWMADVYFDNNTYATYWNMIDVKFDTVNKCKFSDGTYTVGTNATFWIS